MSVDGPQLNVGVTPALKQLSALKNASTLRRKQPLARLFKRRSMNIDKSTCRPNVAPSSCHLAGQRIYLIRQVRSVGKAPSYPGERE